jgi:L-alanine-DL-glutamate epimerase-like enolase superfamily enzyme
VRLDYDIYGARLRAPFVSAQSLTEVRPLVGVRLTDDDGRVGRGEAAPLEEYDGVSVDQVVAALEAWRPGAPLPQLPQAAAAIDLALWDLRGHREGEPVWRLLGADAPPRVPVNATIGAVDPGRAAALAQQASAAGFTCVKLKLGTGDDLARVRAVRAAAGPELMIRLDANGAWSVEEALAMLRELSPLGIECCEEPVHGVEALALVAAASPVAIAADETVADETVFARRVCAAVCLKISSCAGITGLLRDAARARAVGYEVYLASTLDGPPGIAAALHAAAVVRPDRPCGLATLALFEDEDPLPPEDGWMLAPTGPGLIG